MNLHEAFKSAITDDVRPEVWKEAEKALTRGGWCPHCACEGERVKLGRYEAPTHDTYGGRECPQCESFVVCGTQAGSGEFLRAEEIEVDASGCCYSDADPGL